MELSNEQLSVISNKLIPIDTLYVKYAEIVDCIKVKMWIKDSADLSGLSYKNIIDDEDSIFDSRKMNLISFSWRYLRDNMASIIAPATNFNLLINIYIDYLKKLDICCPDSHVEFLQYFVAIQNCLISIKGGIDRMVQLLSFYFQGFSKRTTFGHINDNGKYSGFLSYANENRSKNEMFEYILSQYHSWIKDCVAPRDELIHYKDSLRATGGNSLGLYEPMGLFTKSKKIVNLEMVENYIKKYYELLDVIFKYLIYDDKTIVKCDFYGVVLPPYKVKMFIEEESYNPLVDSELKPSIQDSDW